VAKLVDAANVTATRNGLGSTFIELARPITIGAIIAAAALLDMPSVNKATTIYVAARSNTGPYPSNVCNILSDKKLSPPFCSMATPSGMIPPSRKIIF